MPQLNLPTFLAALSSGLPTQANGRFCVAYSGGLDSTVLLDLVHAAVRECPQYSMYAVHIDHQLHPDSAYWEQHCAASVKELGVHYLCQRVDVSARATGLESGARTARYDAMRAVMQPGDTLLTAHHADDQLETLLLALMRGSGVPGLAAMPVCQRAGQAWHVRPLLEFTREQIEEWARHRGLTWLSDPSNDRLRFDRNYLRHEVIPRLRERWPALAQNAVRSAAHLGEAHELLDQTAAADLMDTSIGNCLNVERWGALSAVRRKNVLRHWLKSRGARMPSTRKLAAIERDMLVAGSDRTPCVQWDGFELRRHRGVLYVERQRTELAAIPSVLTWDWREPLALPGSLGRLRVEGVASGGVLIAKLPERIEVRFRSGGEMLQPMNDPHHRKLKKLLQSGNVLPWWRDRVPLLYARGRLAAVGDLWIEEEFAAKNEPGVRIVWDEKPTIATVTSGKR